jgi:hypothetical protein
MAATTLETPSMMIAAVSSSSLDMTARGIATHAVTMIATSAASNAEVVMAILEREATSENA